LERPHARAQPRRQHHGVFGRGRGFRGFGHQGGFAREGLKLYLTSNDMKSKTCAG
jgi:hypothetical protein